MLSVKQSGIKYHFLSLWYDSTWDWTPVSWAIGEQANHYANSSIQRIAYRQILIVYNIEREGFLVEDERVSFQSP